MTDTTDDDQIDKIGEVVDADIANDTIKVKSYIPAEDLSIGSPYMIRGKKCDFYCVSSNIFHFKDPLTMKLANLTIDLEAPIQEGDDAGSPYPMSVPAILELSCLKIMRRNDDEGLPRSSGFKTIPALHSIVTKASEEDIQHVVEGMFKQTDTTASIGHFLGTKYNIPINFTELFRVPFGIFGKTGFGKTVTTKDILIRALNDGAYVDDRPVQFIIFDAHSEYARGVGKSGSLGLFQFVPDKLHQLSIDLESTTSASTTPLYIDPSKLAVTDWLNAFWDYTPGMEVLLKQMESERLKEIASGKNHATNADLGAYVEQFPDQFGNHPAYTVNAVWKRMSRFNEKVFRRFLVSPPKGHEDVITSIYKNIKDGKSLIIHFGRYSSDANVYTFITNYITRKLYNKYSFSLYDEMREMPHLVLMVEEAHRFIPSAKASGQISFTGASYFHKIARETRKFGLTAGFVDQRPSQLDDEVVSQLGSRFLHRLDDPTDVKIALSGLDMRKWSPIISKLGNGETVVFGNVVGDIPTLIKPFWSEQIAGVKEFFGINAITPDMFAQKNDRMTEHAVIPDPPAQRLVITNMTKKKEIKQPAALFTKKRDLSLSNIEDEDFDFDSDSIGNDPD